MSSKPGLSYLDLINLCDNVHLPVNGQISPNATGFDAERLIPLYLNESPDSAIIGLLRPIIIEQLKAENARSRELGLRELWDMRVEESEYRLLKNGRVGPSVSFGAWCDTPSKRTEAMKELCERWRDTGLFADVCGPKKWRGELYPVYGDPFGVRDHPKQGGDETKLNYAFEMERSACALFGIVTYGVHMSIYKETVDEQGNKSLSVWVPTRSRTKQTYVPCSVLLYLSLSDYVKGSQVCSIIPWLGAFRAGWECLSHWSRSAWRRLAWMLRLSRDMLEQLGRSAISFGV